MAEEDLSNISGLGKLSIELLETIGVTNLDELSRGNADDLLVELTKANRILEIRKKAPTTVELRNWIDQACELSGYDLESEIVKLEHVAPDIEEVLVAIAVPGKNLMGKGIKVTDVPIIELIERSKETIVSERKSQIKGGLPKDVVKDLAVKNVIKSPAKEPLDMSQKKEVEPLQSKKERDVRTRTSAGLNEGKKEYSRSFIRGVLYPNPMKLRIASLVAILFFLSILTGIGGAIMILLTQKIWWAAAPAATIVLGLLYLMVASKIKCRVCGQPFYMPKGCRKHIKAHHIPLIGYIFPTSLQMLIFHWFRCIYCGTSVRLKE